MFYICLFKVLYLQRYRNKKKVMVGGCLESLKGVRVVEYEFYEIQKEIIWDGKF